MAVAAGGTLTHGGLGDHDRRWKALTLDGNSGVTLNSNLTTNAAALIVNADNNADAIGNFTLGSNVAVNTKREPAGRDGGGHSV